MVTELFLILITLCAAFVKKAESAPALFYCLLSFMFYFACKDITDSYVYIYAMASEGILVAVLTGLKGCLNSTLIKYLIPISYLAVCTHFYGWLEALNGAPPDSYNHLVMVYWGVIITLFLSVGKWWNGSDNRVNRLLRDTNHNNGII